MFERFTESGRHIVILAHQEADRLGHSAIESDHMLLAILLQPQYTKDDDSRRAADALGALGVTLTEARERVAGRHDRLSEPQTSMTLSDDAKSALEQGLRVALASNEEEVRPTDFLLGFADKPELQAAQVLEDFSVSAEALRQRLKKTES
jgi:ATP-dependent Clp protease ATP-binding subunit ClpC